MRVLRRSACVVVLVTTSLATICSANAWEDGNWSNNSHYGWRNNYDSPAPRLHESGNSCAPDRAEPVWGGNNSFQGYECVTESANGS